MAMLSGTERVQVWDACGTCRSKGWVEGDDGGVSQCPDCKGTGGTNPRMVSLTDIYNWVDEESGRNASRRSRAPGGFGPF